MNFSLKSNYIGAEKIKNFVSCTRFSLKSLN